MAASIFCIFTRPQAGCPYSMVIPCKMFLGHPTLFAYALYRLTSLFEV